jgi:RNA polymerase II subunit A small phosphatase-like protein
MNRHLLILDIDETLVYGTEEPLQYEHDFRVGRYYIYRRPGLDAFITGCHELFDLAVWSSSDAAYAGPVMSRILPPDIGLQFLWSRERCTRRSDPESREEFWLKDLKKVKRRGYDLDRVLMVDDTKEKLARNYGNLITVKPFYGEPGDTELALLAKYLRSLATRENIRTVEKRRWRLDVKTL